MPELPEVETVRRGLAVRLEGRRLARVEARRPDLRRPFPPDFARRLQGRRILRLGRRAKYIQAFLDNGTVLLVHLGMSGRMVILDVPRAPEIHDHVVLETDDGCSVFFSDPRRFGLMDLVAEEGLDSHPLLAGLGPEPLGDDFTGAVLSAALLGRRAPIKTILLDQRIVAGLGNIYVCEALYRARIDPARSASSVAGAPAARLVDAIKDVLTEAIAAGGSTLRDYVQSSGELGYFQHAFAVYGREGAPCPECRCRAGVRRIVQGGRSTFYCPKRQR